MIQLTILGKPTAKARPRFFRKGKHIGTYNPQTAEEKRFLHEVQQQYTGEPLSGPLWVDMEFVIPRPKKHFRTGKYAHYIKDTAPFYCVNKPDVDNLIKFAMDCMGCLYDDDKSVVAVRGVKRYGSKPRTIIKVWGI